MSTNQGVAAIVAAATFVVTGGNIAATQFAFAATQVVMGAVNPDEGPGPGELGAPQIQQGGVYPRVYGRVRVPVSPLWVSDFTATANDTGGKGGPPEGSAGYSYSLDLLGALADGLNVVGMTRVWVNKKLVYTALADSTEASVAASDGTDSWSAVELFTGGAAQVPWGVYETSVGAAYAVAYRHQCTIGFTGLQCGGSKTPPLVEVEVITQGTQGQVDPLTLLQSFFTGNSSEDISAYARGPGTLVGDASISGDVLRIDQVASPLIPSYLEYYPSGMNTVVGEPLTIECFATWSSSPNAAGIPFMELFRNLLDSADYARFSWYGDSGGVAFQTAGFGDEYISPSPLLGRNHYAIVWSVNGLSAYINGVNVYTTGTTALPGTVTQMRVRLGDFNAVVGPSVFTIDSFRLQQEEVYTVDFTPPAELPDPDAGGGVWTPGLEDLQDIVDAELAVNEAVDPADHDTDALAGITVRGFKAAGSAGTTIAQLGDIFYFDCIPGNPVRYVPRGEAAVATIPFEDTGIGRDQSNKPFVGIKRGNNAESPAVFGLSAPNILQDHDIVYERGDRLTTDGPDVRKFSTNVVLEPDEVKGRAITATLMNRASSHTADFALSDEYAKLEPGDACTVTAEDASTYSLLIRRLTYADGVKQIGWELNDTSALVETGLTDETYTSSIVVATPVESDLTALDVPILLDADDNAGAYVAVEGLGSEAFPGAVVRRSTDNVDFGETATTHTTEATVGTTTTALDDWAGGYLWDESSSVTVTVGTGQTLASSTAAAMQLDRTINAAFVGAHGRWELIRFRTATLDATAVYTLTGLLRGCRGTEAHIGSHVIGDVFVLATTAGLRRMSGEVADIGNTRYLKAVTNGRPLASATAETFTNEAVGLLPFSPKDLRASRDGSNNVTFTWARRTRLAVRYGGAGGTYKPLGEDSERYEIDIYASSGYVAVLRTIVATSETAAYSAAEQTADGLTPGNTVYARVYQLSAAVGRGSYLEANA